MQKSPHLSWPLCIKSIRSVALILFNIFLWTSHTRTVRGRSAPSAHIVSWRLTRLSDRIKEQKNGGEHISRGRWGPDKGEGERGASEMENRKRLHQFIQILSGQILDSFTPRSIHDMDGVVRVLCWLLSNLSSRKERMRDGGRRGRLLLQQIRRTSNHYQRRHRRRRSHGDGTKMDGFSLVIKMGDAQKLADVGVLSRPSGCGGQGGL